MNFLSLLIVPLLAFFSVNNNVIDFDTDNISNVNTSKINNYYSDNVYLDLLIPDPVPKTATIESLEIPWASGDVIDAVAKAPVPECTEKEELIDNKCVPLPDFRVENKVEEADSVEFVSSFELVFPLKSGTYTKTSGYGHRIHPITGDYTFHSGTDYAAPSGTFIYAMHDGIVESVAYDSSGGWYVIIDHGNGVKTAYLHQEHEYIVVSEGETVKAGQHIGGVGNTGSSTGAHLHFNVEIDGETIDSDAYLFNSPLRFP